MNIFSILAMLSKSKRVFSSTKHILSDERAQLKSHTIEALKCVKHSMRQDLYIDANLIVVIVAKEDN